MSWPISPPAPTFGEEEDLDRFDVVLLPRILDPLGHEPSGLGTVGCRLSR